MIEFVEEVDLSGVHVEMGTDGVMRISTAEDGGSENTPDNNNADMSAQPAPATTSATTTASTAASSHTTGDSVRSSNNASSAGTTTASAAAAEAERTRKLLDGLAKQAIGPNFVRVDIRQKGNPVLRYVRNVPWQFCEQPADFVLGKRSCALFLSLRYHLLHPEYIHGRIREVGQLYQLRVLLVLVDVRDSQAVLMDLARLCLVHNYTLMLGWSNREVGRYIETYKAYEHKSSDALQQPGASDYLSQVVACLTAVRSVNKTDAVTLLSTFGSVRGIVAAGDDEVRLCPGFGDKKVSRMTALFTQPFRNPKSHKPSRFSLTRSQQQQEEGEK